MCGRFSFTDTPDPRWVRERFGAPGPPDPPAGRWNIAPTDSVLTIGADREGELGDKTSISTGTGLRPPSRGSGDCRSACRPSTGRTDAGVPGTGEEEVRRWLEEETWLVKISSRHSIDGA